MSKGQNGPLYSQQPRKVKNRGIKIAIVDDIAELSRLYSTALKLYGHEIAFIASSGEEAVEAAKQGKFSDVECLIIDYRMAGMNGLEAAEMIARSTPHVRILIASAETSIRDQVEAVGFRYISKPFTMTELVDRIL
ncbi:MAG: response regulator transcription factor [Nitrososphaerales archaeon]